MPRSNAHLRAIATPDTPAVTATAAGNGIAQTRVAGTLADPTTPALVEGLIGHVRTRPARNAFVYSAFCLRLPLSRLSELPARGIALNRRGVLSFHERDHGARDGSPLAPWIAQLLASEGIEADGEAVLYTFPRMLGYLFNPVSFWLCHDRHNHVRAILAEVCNTFGEQHNYLLAHADGRPIRAGETLTAHKVFHVSPFCEVKGRYRFRFQFGAHWLARIDYDDSAVIGMPLLETWISGDARPLARSATRWLPLRYPWFTLAVMARIHWQALKLAGKRVPFFRKPAPPLATTTRQ
jgi:DUF1365 family protein